MAPSLAPKRSRSKTNMYSELVGMAGFEPAASCSQSRRANQAAPHPAGPIRSLPPDVLAVAAAPFPAGLMANGPQFGLMALLPVR
jgi:hypothetical protein